MKQILVLQMIFKRLDNILQNSSKSLDFTIERPVVEDLPNNIVDKEKDLIKTEDIYIHDSPLKEIKFFLPQSTDT